MIIGYDVAVPVHYKSGSGRFTPRCRPFAAARDGLFRARPTEEAAEQIHAFLIATLFGIGGRGAAAPGLSLRQRHVVGRDVDDGGFHHLRDLCKFIR